MLAFLKQPSSSLLARGTASASASESASASDFSRIIQLHEMKCPILDRLAYFVFQLKNNRVARSTIVDFKGRYGEPMEWAEENSIANQFTKIVSLNDMGYQFKQGIANLVTRDYNEGSLQAKIVEFVDSNPMALYLFTMCPFCRKFKDFLDKQKIPSNVV